MMFFRPSSFGVRVIVSLLALASLAGLGAQHIVYDNTTNRLGTYAEEEGEFGDELQLAGTARTLTDISFEYYGDFAQQGDEMAKVRLYSNETQYDLYRKEPTTVLYETGFFGIEPGYNSLRLPGFSTLLSDIVTFTIEFRGLAEDETAGLLLYSPPTVGRTFNEFWRRNEAGRWQSIIYSLTNLALKANASIRLRAVETVRLESVKVSSTGTLQFAITGLTGASYTIESSSNLTNWSVVATEPVSGPNATFTSAIPSTQRQQFYRVGRPLSEDPGVVPTVRLESVKVSDTGTLQFAITGLTGANYIIESSDNLKDWSFAASQPVSGPNATFNSATPATQRKQFYRVRLPLL